MDVEGKPWRGRMYGTSESVHNFFHHTQYGYNKFILHYAELVKDKIDAFIIGSELVGITKICYNAAQSRIFPVVEELVNLATAVRKIFGSRNIKITYAADWSEYHHTDDGWYNLDRLWMCEAIDFIGIDAYFPVTDTTNSNVTYEDMYKSWNKGNTYDYYYDNHTKKYCSPEYALKNIQYWWENKHINPNGQSSVWVPKQKKIWFTEFGFASIDKTTN